MEYLIAFTITIVVVLGITKIIFPKKKNEGEQSNILDEQRATEIRESAYIKEEIKKGKPSIWNFNRGSTQLSYLVGFPLYLFISTHGLSVGFAIMVSILPSWVVFRVIEYTLIKKKIVALSDDELTNISNTRVGELGYELQKIAQDEIRRRSSSL